MARVLALAVFAVSQDVESASCMVKSLALGYGLTKASDQLVKKLDRQTTPQADQMVVSWSLFGSLVT